MKNIRMQRVIIVLIVMTLIFSAFSLAACANQETDTEDPSKEIIPAGDEGEEESPTEEPRVEPDVPNEMFDYTLNVMHWTVIGLEDVWTIWEEICPEEDITSHTGDLLADDIYDRTAWLEENYGITITQKLQEHIGLPTAVANMISSGSDEFQLLVEFGFDAQRVFGKNYFLDLSTLEYIDFEKPWWVDSAISELRLGDYVEFGVSDMLLLDKASTTMMFYNIRMADDLGITGLYDEVESYNWTIETLAEYAELALSDDGDEEWTELDTYGLISGDDPTHNFYIGAGKHFIARDGDDYYYQYGSDEETLDIMTTILDEIMYQDFMWNTWQNQDATNISFKAGSALFTVATARSCNELRQMEDNYGILPNPMYDKYQKQYYSQVSNYGDSMFAVFNTAGEPDTVAAALELLSYYSYYEVYPDFYDVVIQGRGTRDAESREMLDIIFSGRTYDLGLLYDPHGVTDAILRYPAKEDTNLSSFIATWEPKLDDAIEGLIALRDEYN